MSRNVTNAVYGVLDYASYPVGMLLMAPIVLHRIGAAEYGLWMISTSVISAGGIIASGFCDAGIQQIAKLHGQNVFDRAEDTVRTLFAMNLTLGCIFALLMGCAAPYAAHRLSADHTLPLKECLVCLWMASAAILVRAIETVPVCIQRAFEEYRGTVRISVAIRILTLSAAAALAVLRHHVVSIMALTVALLLAGTLLQFQCLHKFLTLHAFLPCFHMHELRTLLHSGIFVWAQALGSVLFRQLDRIFLGLSLGAAAVVPYSLSIQLSEPLFGLTASCLSFFFPYLSGRAQQLSPEALRHTVLKGFLCNLLLVSSGAAILLLIGRQALRLLAGPSVESGARSILPLIVVGSALSGLSVVGTYSAQALGMFRTVSSISIVSRAGLLLLMLSLLHHQGLSGLAIARVCYGAASLLVYLPLIRHLGLIRKKHVTPTDIPLATNLQGRGSL